MSSAISIVKYIVGWVYFACWSLSFYPQVYLNYKKKSVIGLSFDFLLFNITGYICYSVFNSFLFWDKYIQIEYLEKYEPPIPIHPSDVAFSLHAFALCSIIIIQCFMYYEKHNSQRLSRIASSISIGIWISIIIVTILGATNVVTWLWVIYYYSYVKLVITFIKYVPQSYSNYKNKSTKGWSIGSVLLDFSGGVLSILEMFLDVVESGNWKVFTGDPVKLALALVSVAFDLLFMVQHYVLYPHPFSDIDKNKGGSDINVNIKNDVETPSSPSLNDKIINEIKQYNNKI